MARQSLSLGLLALAACNPNSDWAGNFDVPESITIVSAGEHNPFDEPIAYAASLHGGRIHVLSLREGRFLADTQTSSILRAAPLATGAERVLGSIAAVAPGDGSLTVYAADRAFARVLRVPHLVAGDGLPERVPTTVGTPEFVDADASGDSPSLIELRALTGYAATEDWTLTFDGDVWRADGSRSGRLDTTAVEGELFEDERGGLSFTAVGPATAGDHFIVSFDNGVTELDVGGVPLHLATSPSQDRLAVILARDEDPAVLAWLDPATGQLDKDVPLPPEATPVRMAWAANGDLFVADASLSAFWQITPGGDDDDTVVQHVLPWSVTDVAPLLTETGGTVTVSPLGQQSVWMYDLQTQALRDLNPLAPGVNGIDTGSVIQGLGSIEQPFLYPEVDDYGIERRGRGVAVTLQRGTMVILGEETGCLITDGLGPRTVPSAQVSGFIDYTFIPGDAQGAASLEQNASNDRSVIVNRCGGVARSEQWTLSYDANAAGWRVEGELSGEQQALAFEDQRYVSDDGAISFVIQSGALPSETGHRIRFNVTDGLLAVTGDNDGDGLRDITFSLPGDPVAYREVKTLTDDLWQPVVDQPYVVVPVTGADLVAKVDPLTAIIDMAWW